MADSMRLPKETRKGEETFPGQRVGGWAPGLDHVMCRMIPGKPLCATA